MANVRISLAQRNAHLDAIRTAIDVSGPGLIKMYTGTQPATADTALSGNTLLGTLTFSGTSAPAASGGVLTFNAITRDSAADADGTVTWARITNGAAATVFDCDVGLSGTTIVMNNVALVTGGPIEISSFTLTEAA